jgi:BolA family transcriptional regulator, general stress-responsive regulator
VSPAERAAEIERRLKLAFDPLQLRVEDESHHHAGHAGAKDGRSHFRVRITARTFSGLGPIKRHQQIYSALGDLMRTDIHALAIEARAPDEPAG